MIIYQFFGCLYWMYSSYFTSCDSTERTFYLIYVGVVSYVRACIYVIVLEIHF